MARTTTVKESAWTESFAGVWDSHPGGTPEVAVVAGVHGDEWASVDAIRKALTTFEPWELAHPARLVIANPAALAASVRFTPGGTDLNRCFGPDSAPQGEESKRMEILKEALSGVPLVLDLHQTHCPTPPLAVVPDSPVHFDAGLKLGVEWFVTGASALYGGAMLTDWVDRNGGLGLTFETGEADQPEAFDFAFHLVRDAILGLRSRPARRARKLAVVGPIRAPFSGGRWTRQVGNGSACSAGEVLWSGADGEWSPQENGVLLLPHHGVAEGEVLAVMARDEGWYEA